jgi:CheY-like chemotaxis protein
MPSEKVLVVDDTPVNLKLSGILLRKEGYIVHVSSDADQALALATDVCPDIILVATELPGMGGFELIRRVRQDERTRDTVIVALTGSGPDEGTKATDAGANGFIPKPIQTLTLTRQIREYLTQRKVARPEADTGDFPSFPAGIALSGVEMESVRRRFLSDSVAQVQRMLAEPDERVDEGKLLRQVQDWARAAAVLDFGAIALLAREVEKLLRTGRPSPADIQDALSNLMVAFVEPPEGTLGPVPDFITEALRGKRIALVGFSGEEAEQLCGALERASARPRLFGPEVLDCDAIRDCTMTLVRVGPDSRNWFMTQRPGQLNESPLILAGPRDLILALDRSVHLRAEEFLIDGWQPEEALIRLTFALLRRGRAPAVEVREELAPNVVPVVAGAAEALGLSGDVLLADDDLTVRLLLRSAFQSVGIKCLLAANGTEALGTLRAARPAVAVLDINMPGMDGYEVLAAARGEGIRTKVMLLTARQQEADVTRGFTLGADDYVTKPFNPAELVARVKRLLK